jgi:phosphoserine aminotransferase
VLNGAFVGRSHRAKEGKRLLKLALDKTREILGLPGDFRVGIVPGSDTGAVEMALWSLLGARGVDVLAWESFGKGWVTDVVKQLRLGDVRVLEADYGELPDLSKVDWSRDAVFTWNGTTSGVRVPNADWIAENREGLTIVDATSAIFAQPMDWSKTDVVTYSWQKVLGGEAAHGLIILSPRAVQRLESYMPAWPMPKLFRLTRNGKLDEAIFQGETINTPSMLCVADYLDTLAWAESVGGLQGLMRRADANAAALDAWVRKTPWIENLAKNKSTQSNTSVCLAITDARVAGLNRAAQMEFIKGLVGMLEGERVAYDIASYRDAPPGLRIWTGATVETADVEALLPWLEWAFAQAVAKVSSA